MTSLRRPPSSLVFPAALRRWTRRIQANVALSLVTIPVSCCLRRRSRPDQGLIDLLGSEENVFVPNASFLISDDTIDQFSLAITGGYRARGVWISLGAGLPGQ